MGYIAPVPSYQYIQYRERVIDESRVVDPFHVTKIRKADLKSNLEKSKEFPSGKWNGNQGRYINEYV